MTNFHASTLLTTARTANSTYSVQAKVKRLLYDEMEHPAAVIQPVTSATFKVVPGTCGEIDLAVPQFLPADGKSEQTITATFRDRYGNTLPEGAPITWMLKGGGNLEILDGATDASGTAKAKLKSGKVSGNQTVEIRADGIGTKADVENRPISIQLTSSKTVLDTAITDSATLRATVNGVRDGTSVRWLTARGELLDAQTSISDGSATATLQTKLDAVGNSLVAVGVGDQIKTLTLSFTSSAPICATADSPLVAADTTADGEVSVESLGGGTDSIPFTFDTPVHLSAPFHPNAIVRVAVGRVRPATLSRFRLDQMATGETPDSAGSLVATVNGATLDTLTKHSGNASFRFNGNQNLVIADHPTVRVKEGMRISGWIRSDIQTGATLVEKTDEYRLTLAEGGAVTFSVQTIQGTRSVTSQSLLQLGD